MFKKEPQMVIAIVFVILLYISGMLYYLYQGENNYSFFILAFTVAFAMPLINAIVSIDDIPEIYKRLTYIVFVLSSAIFLAITSFKDMTADCNVSNVSCDIQVTLITLSYIALSMGLYYMVNAVHIKRSKETEKLKNEIDTLKQKIYSFKK